MSAPRIAPCTSGAKPPLDLVIAAPRGFCAGVDRAIQIVELAIKPPRGLEVAA